MANYSSSSYLILKTSKQDGGYHSLILSSPLLLSTLFSLHTSKHSINYWGWKGTRTPCIHFPPDKCFNGIIHFINNSKNPLSLCQWGQWTVSSFLKMAQSQRERERDEQIPIYCSFVNFKGQISAASARWFWVSFTIYLLKC